MFQGRTGIVTGAATGIGRASALAFARHGARVCVADVDDTRGEETVALIRGDGGEAFYQRTDVTNWKDVSAMVAATVRTFGPLNFALNNAGVAGLPGQAATTVLCTEENWNHQIAINLTGVWLCMKAQIPEMRKAGGGSIVNTSSPAGLVATPGNVAYSASKHGVIGLTKTAAVEYAQAGLRINALCPGMTDTDMVRGLKSQGEIPLDIIRPAMKPMPIGRLADPDEIAAVAIWLCSDAASFVTGHAMVADGGHLAF